MLSNGEVNLDRYRCAKCSRKPSVAIEILKGCTCGHRLFRLQLSNNSSVSKEKLSHTTKLEKHNFLTIRERQVGIYDINVEKLLKPEIEEEESPVIAGNNGIYSIRLDSRRKKTISQ